MLSTVSSTLVVLALLSSTASSVSSTRSATCKAVPGSPHWPVTSVWQAFNKTLDGGLLAPLPPAIVCDQSSTVYDQKACHDLSSVTEWFSSSFHADNPVSIDWPLWQDDACLPPALLDQSLGKCNLQPFPQYVVNASTGQHVSAALKFAAKHNVRLSVKGTGHDLLGRSTGPGLSIWTHNLRGIEFTDSFKPRGCGKCAGQPAVVVGAGEQWGDVYTAIAPRDQYIVGGGDPGVGLGGWTTGGGHSPLSAIYGLGADNVLEIEMVTPMGEIVTANAYQHTDLFWAMRGGGGATFGIALSFTYKTHPASSVTSFILEFNSTEDEASKNQNTHFYEMVAYVNAQLPMLSDAGLMGYYYINPASHGATGNGGAYYNGTTTSPSSPAPPPVPMSFAFLGIALNTSTTHVTTLFDPITTRISSTVGLSPPLFLVYPQTTLNLLAEVIRSLSPVGVNVRLGSRLMDRKAMLNESGWRETLPQLARTGLQGIFVSGPGVRAVKGDENAVNPAWREAYLHALIPLAIPFPSSPGTFPALSTAYATFLTHTLMPPLIALAGGANSGAYVNEADPNEPDWQTVFWGGNYPRLKRIKGLVDPGGVLWCEVCVGGEGWRVVKEGEEGMGAVVGEVCEM